MKIYRIMSIGLIETTQMTLLFVDERAVAYNLGLVFDDTYYYLKTSFDETFKAQSPATVARARLVADTIARGLATLDFPAEPYEWEAQWTSELRWHRSVLLFNRGVRAGVFNVVQRLRDAWRRRPPERTDIHGPSKLALGGGNSERVQARSNPLDGDF